jgi:pimeloyl-ACP methyl ester carboxylesterase
MTQQNNPLLPIHVEQRGSGPRVVFVHGGEDGGGSVAFAAQFPLEQAYTLILPDLPGFGKSFALADGVLDPAHDAPLIADLLGTGAHLVGHSYGRAVALLAASQRPEAVRSLTLIEPATFDLAVQDPAVQQWMTQRAQALALPDPRQRLVAFGAVVGIHKTWPDPLPAAALRLAEKLGESRTLPKPSRSLAEQVATAGVPALLISGGERAAFEKVCDALAAVLHGQRAVITGYGHAPHYSGEPFNRRVQRFWASLLQKPAVPPV